MTGKEESSSSLQIRAGGEASKGKGYSLAEGTFPFVFIYLFLM